MIAYLRIAIAVSLVTLIFGCAGSPDAKPRWVEAPGVDIPAYTTFSWMSRSDESPVTILDNQIRDAIRTQLTAKGYVESSDEPDFLVDHETLEQDAIEQGNPVRIGIGVGSWGGNVGGSVGTSVDVGDKDKMVHQLRISIRALDPGDRREVWAGTTAPMAERPDASTVTRTVAGVMSAFPERRR